MESNVIVKDIGEIIEGERNSEKNEESKFSDPSLRQTIEKDSRKARLAVLRIKNEKKLLQNSFEIGTLDKNEVQIEFISDFEWRLGIRGRKGTIWEGGLYCATISFPNDYPESPPLFIFDKDFEHIHIYNSGDVCLDLVNKELTYKATVTMILMIGEICRLIHEKPNPKSPANAALNKLYLEDKEAYEMKIKATAAALKDKKPI